MTNRIGVNVRGAEIEQQKSNGCNSSQSVFYVHCIYF